jgi:hypothetical protein
MSNSITKIVEEYFIQVKKELDTFPRKCLVLLDDTEVEITLTFENRYKVCNIGWKDHEVEILTRVYGMCHLGQLEFTIVKKLHTGVYETTVTSTSSPQLQRIVFYIENKQLGTRVY